MLAPGPVAAGIRQPAAEGNHFMARPTALPSAPGPAQRATQPTLPAYSRDAATYDARTGPFDRYRRQIVDLLPLERDDVVLDIGCGTGLCFAQVQEHIGPGGTIVGIDTSADMLTIAAERVTSQRWANVVLVEAAVEHADLPDGADHALFCAVHDVLQSGPALDHVLAHVREHGGVAAGGGKWAPAWAMAVNAAVLALHTPYVRDFTGFDRPWTGLAERIGGMQVQEVGMGGGYMAYGEVPRDAGHAVAVHSRCAWCGPP
jgi:demethylmenaquinone methyltransferase/2-methoxy-6-polyprenyl-1,4-benzoquinol methylase